ncbi:unnamed protein product, partial [Hymenolepis diminuta]
KVSQIELLFYAAVYAFSAIGYQLYCEELEKQPYHEVLPKEGRLILWGFYNSLGKDYLEVRRSFEIIPYFAVHCLLCLLINISNVPYKTTVVESVSIGIMVSLHGVTLVGVIITMMAVM